MKVNLYSVFDTKMECFHQPFACNNDAVAERAFNDMSKNPQLPYGQHPKDYCLYRLGTFDDHSGQIEGEKIVSLGITPEVVS